MLLDFFRLEAYNQIRSNQGYFRVSGCTFWNNLNYYKKATRDKGYPLLPIGNSPLAICGGCLCKLTLPTAKAGGFLFLPPLHWQIPYGTAMSYTVSTGYIYTVPACPAVQFSYLYADCSCSPFFKILMPAFVSRSWTAWQPGHSQIRMRRFITPQKQQVKVSTLPLYSLALPPFCFQKGQPSDYPYHVLIWLDSV